MELLTDRRLREAIPLHNAMAVTVTILALAALLSLGKEVFIPLALAMLLSFALAPAAGALERLGLGRSLSVAVTVVLFLAVVAAVGYVVFAQATELAGQLPSYRSTIRDKLRGLTAGMGEGGAFARVMELVADLSKDLAPKPAVGTPTVVLASADQSGLAALKATFGPLLGGLATFGAVVLIMAFTLLQREDLRNRVIKLIGADDIQQTTALLDDAGSRLGRLLLAQIVVNLVFAGVVGAALWLIGLPSPFLWGILAGVLRYVPYIGAVMGVAPPLVIAFAVDPTWTSFLWTAAFFAVIEFFVGHVLEPMLYGRRTGLSPFAVIVSVTVWAFLWGTIGLVMAIPLTICLVVLGRHVGRLSFLDTILGDRPALPPHEVLYQRLLAGDPREAVRNARGILGDRALTTYYDHVMLPGLRRAHVDITRGTVSGDRLERMVAGGAQVIDAIARMPAGRVATRRLAPEAAELLERLSLEAGAGAGHAHGALSQAAGRTVAIIHGAHPLDRLPAAMLAHVLRSYGLDVRLRDAGREPRCAAVEDAGSISVVVLSYMEPLSTVHMRAAIISARRAAPGAGVVVALWQDMTDELRQMLRTRLRVDATASSVREALEMIARAL
jgi:predicted PurR-regulated permease PerM